MKKDFSTVLETLTDEQREAMNEYVALVRKIVKEQVLSDALTTANQLLDGMAIRLMLHERWNEVGW